MSRSNLAYMLDYGRRMRERDAKRMARRAPTESKSDKLSNSVTEKPDAHQLAMDADAMMRAIHNARH